MVSKRISGFISFVARTLCVIVGVSLVAGGARAQRPDLDLGKPQIFPNFGLDWAQFQADDTNLTLVEVYYRIPNSGVTFKSVDSGFEASYELYLELMDGDFQIGRREFRRTIFVREYERTKLYTDYVVNMAEFVTDPGDYEIVGTMIDSHSGQQSRRRIKAKVSDFSRSKFPKISGIEFLYSYRPQAGTERFFRKGEGMAVPSVDRAVQGGAGGGPALFYFEIYPGRDPELNLLVDVRMRRKTEGEVYRDTLYVKMDQPIVRQVRNVDLAQFKPGDYEVTVQALTRLDKVVYARSAEFSVSWSLLGMVSDDYESVVRQLSYIATAEERDALEDAETVEDRLTAWHEFWETRDPTPGTAENEAQLSFYARIRYANKHFATSRKEGWRTDRGMVLLRYGAPDEAVDRPVAPTVGEYQVWFYYNFQGEPLRFVFVDEFGDDDYRLQFPYDGRY